MIPHPAFRSDVDRRDDGRTALALGLIRPYKGTEDSVEAVLRVDGARLLVAGDPRVPLDGLQLTAGDRAEWRLGFLPDGEIRRALSEATVALFPYRAEIDVSGALLQVLGAGRAGDRLRHRRARRGRRRDSARARSSSPETSAAWRSRSSCSSADPDALDRRARGAEAARAELTWEASAAAHLELYRELL